MQVLGADRTHTAAAEMEPGVCVYRDAAGRCTRRTGPLLKASAQVPGLLDAQLRSQRRHGPCLLLALDHIKNLKRLQVCQFCHVNNQFVYKRICPSICLSRGFYGLLYTNLLYKLT